MKNLLKPPRSHRRISTASDLNFDAPTCRRSLCIFASTIVSWHADSHVVFVHRLIPFGNPARPARVALHSAEEGLVPSMLDVRKGARISPGAEVPQRAGSV